MTERALKQVSLGRDLTVSELGLGCWGMSSDYGVPDDAESIATIHMAIDRGLNFFDTSDAYAAGVNERLLGAAIKGRREGLVIATKFGNLPARDGAGPGVNGRPEYVPFACEASLRRLGIDTIDLYYQHRIDPNVPIEDTIGAMARLVEQGKVRHIGISEAAPATIERAHAVHPLAAVQMEYSLWSRDAESEVLPLTRRLGIGFVAYSPLGRGFLTAAIRRRDDLLPTDRRHTHPRFQQGNFEANLKLLGTLEAIAREKAAASAQIALAWLLAQGDGIVPIPGTKRRRYLEENLGAAEIVLDKNDLERLNRAFPQDAAAGPRYSPDQLRRVGL